MASQGGHGAALAPPPPADGQSVALQQAQPSFPYPTPSNGNYILPPPTSFSWLYPDYIIWFHEAKWRLPITNAAAGFPPTASPGTKLPGLRGPPATPSQTHGDYKSSPSLTRPSASGGPPVSNPPQPLLTPQSAPAQAQHTAAQLKGFRSGVGNTLADLDIDKLPASQKREGQDWFAVFNPDFTRVLDVDLVHHLVHDSVVCCVRFSADGKYVATGCNRSAQIFDVATGTRLHTLTDISVEKDGDLYIRSVCFSPDGRYLATGAEDRQIRVRCFSFPNIPGCSRSLRINFIQLWDLQTETIKHIFTGHEQDIYSLDFARNGRYIASGSGDKTVRLWDVVERKQKLILSIEDGVTTVAISPDGCYVAAGSLDKSVRVWDTDTGFLVERLVTPDGHRDSVYSVSFAPNGKDLVSGSLDKTIKMWELSPGGPSRSTMVPGVSPRRGKCVRTFEGHKVFTLSPSLSLAFCRHLSCAFFNH